MNGALSGGSKKVEVLIETLLPLSDTLKLNVESDTALIDKGPLPPVSFCNSAH